MCPGSVLNWPQSCSRVLLRRWLLNLAELSPSNVIVSARRVASVRRSGVVGAVSYGVDCGGSEADNDGESVGTANGDAEQMDMSMLERVERSDRIDGFGPRCGNVQRGR